MKPETSQTLRDLAAAENDLIERDRLATLSPADLLAEVLRLRAGIQAYLDGDYPNPRWHRPGKCKHGRPYYEECGACDAEHFEGVLNDVR